MFSTNKIKSFSFSQQKCILWLGTHKHHVPLARLYHYITPDKRGIKIIFFLYLQENICCGTINSTSKRLALVAQLDAHPTENQEVAGLTPAGSAAFFHED